MTNSQCAPIWSAGVTDNLFQELNPKLLDSDLILKMPASDLPEYLI